MLEVYKQKSPVSSRLPLRKISLRGCFVFGRLTELAAVFSRCAAILKHVVCDKILSHLGRALGRFGYTLGKCGSILLSPSTPTQI